jgi:hypothetical protein
MKRITFDTMLQRSHESSRSGGPKMDFPVRINIGKHKGKTGTAQISWYGTKMSVIFPGDTEDYDIPYKNVDLLDENGDVVVDKLVDSTSREIVTGSIICYSANFRNSHSLSIGRVEGISDIGTLKVKEIILNGEKSTARKSKQIGNPEKCIILPISDEDMVIWLLNGFQFDKNK